MFLKRAEFTYEELLWQKMVKNYTMFSSRMLIDTVGDTTDAALEASGLRDVIGVLAGEDYSIGVKENLCFFYLGIKCCALEMAAAGASRFDAERFGVFLQIKSKAM